jgi:hypothetical protein
MTCGYENHTPVGVKIEKQAFSGEILLGGHRGTSKNLM